MRYENILDEYEQKTAYEYIRKKITRIKRLLETSYNNCIFDLDIEELDEIENLTMRVNLRCRDIITTYEEIERECIDHSYLSNREVNPVEIDLSDGLFHARTPLTIRRHNSTSKQIRSENYTILSYFNQAMDKWSKEHPDIALRKMWQDEPLPLMTAVIRYATSYAQCQHCDNDNIENKNLQNRICYYLLLSDSCRSMDYYSCFRYCEKSEDSGTEIVVGPREKVLDYIRPLSEVLPTLKNKRCKYSDCPW